MRQILPIAIALFLAGFSSDGAPMMRVLKTGSTGRPLLANGAFEEPVTHDQGQRFAAWQPSSRGYEMDVQGGRGGTAALRVHNPSGAGWYGAAQALHLNRTNIAPIVVRGWSKAEKVSGSADNDYSLYVDLIYQDGSPLWGQTANFRCGTHDWEFREFLIIPEQPVKTLTLYCLFRNHAGKVWFDDVSVEEIVSTSSTALFQTLPVELAEPPRANNAEIPVHSTQDGLRLHLGDGGTASLELDGNPLAVRSPGGFLARDAAKQSDFYAFTGGACLELGLKLRTTVRSEKDHLVIEGQVADTTGRDRAITLVFALPVDALGWEWSDDIRRKRVIQDKSEYINQVAVGCGATGTLSLYPLAAINNSRHGLALAIDMAQPAVYRLAYNAGTRQMFIAYDFGLVPDTERFPSAAPFRFVIYRYEPQWGFRAAFDKCTRIFPEYFKDRSPDQGIWMPFTDVSTVQGWQDFGFKYHEGNNNVPFDDTNNILSFRYTEPMTWWMKMKKEVPRTAESALQLRDTLAQGGDRSQARLAQVAQTAAMFDHTAQPALLFRDTPWCDGAVWSLNPNPHLPGSWNAATVHWNESIKQQLYGPNAKGRLDGEYLDSLEGYVTADLNFRREHFRYTTVPLTFASETRLPTLHKGLAIFEFTRWFAAEVHALDKLTFANSVPYRFSYLCPWLDVMGTETDWLSAGKYTPASHAQMSLWRTMSGRKPYLLLMNTDYDKFAPELVERYFQRSLFYGMFPSMFSHNAADNPYWRKPEWYNRDRALFKKYLPVIKRVAEAGWQPVTDAHSDNPRIWIERYGPNTRGEVYFTLLNDTAQSQEGIITTRPGKAVDPLCGETFSPQAARRMQLAPGAVKVLVCE